MKLTKRRGILLLVLALSLAVAVPVSHALEVRDVPQGHWAYEAVRTLVEKGYLPVGEDQLFKGNEPTDRYTLATVVAKMLAEVESGRVSTTPDDVRTLRNLTDELRADLVKYYADLQRMEGQVAGAHQKLTAYDERLVQVITDLGGLYRRADAIEQTLQANKLHGDEALQGEALLIKQRLDALGDSLAVDLRSLRGEVDAVSELLDTRSYEFNAADLDLRQQISALSQSLKAEADGLRGETAQLGQRIDKERADRATSITELEQRVNESFNQHGLQLAGQSTEVSHRLAELGRDLTALEDNLNARLAANDQKLVSVDQAFVQVREALNEHSEMLAAYEVALALLTQDLVNRSEALGRADGQLLSSVEQLRQQLDQTRQNSEAVAEKNSQLEAALRMLENDLTTQVSALVGDNRDLSNRLDDVRQEILIVQSQIGLSEEQVSELTRRVREEMAEQLTLSLVREGELQRNVIDLRREFDSFRDTTQAELKSARGAQAMSIGALIIGVIALLR